jgi:hypothetical protein
MQNTGTAQNRRCLPRLLCLSAVTRGPCRDLAVATVLVFGDYETVAIVLVLAAFGVAIWYQVRKGRKKSTVKLALWLALLIVLWWFGTGHGATPPQH